MYPGTWAAETPDKPAVIYPSTGESVSYAQLDARSNQLAHYWREQGLRVGDHVAIVMENHSRYVDAMWAALRSGLIVTPVNHHLATREIAHILTDSEAKAVVVSATQAERVEPLLGADVAARSLVVGSADSQLPVLEKSVAAMPQTPVDVESLGTDMYYTSGTTGLPKGGVQDVPGGHPRDGAWPILPFFRALGLTSDSVYLSPGSPLYHAAPGRTVQAVTALGGTAVVLDHFDAATAMEAIDRYGITDSQWVPTMFIRMLRLPDEVRASYSGETHRVAVHAAAPCPIWAKEAMIQWWGPILLEYYGGSEGGSITMLDSHEWLAHKGSVGKPMMGSVHITDDDTGEELGVGEIGTVRFDCPARPVRYRNDPDKTSSAYDERGWSTVGDVGYVDADGYLYLTDRKAYMIISGGVNIYPQEIEDVLLQHPDVLDAAVFGIPNAEYGEEVKAAVELVDHARASDSLGDSLIAFCRENLASYKCPRSIDFEKQLPRTDAGKLYKRELRDRYLGDGPNALYHDLRPATAAAGENLG